jgi:hypothetical protein
MMLKIAFVDLDGTITLCSVNNTFDFIREYYMYRFGRIGWLVYHCIMLVAHILLKILRVPHYIVDVLIINMLFFGHRKKSLDCFSIIFWLNSILKHVNWKVISLLSELKNKGYKIVMLTCCTEVPALHIATALKLDGCLCRNFKLVRGFIIGLSENVACYMLKSKNIKSYLGALSTSSVKSIYIVDKDSLRDEAKIFNLFNKILIIES